MDPRKDVDINGQRVVNVADPTELNHVTTKRYVDSLHYAKRPTDDKEEYVKYINLRNTTCLPLTALCSIHWNIKWEITEERGIPKETTGPHVLLESNTSPAILHVSPQKLEHKYISIAYRFPVVVKFWYIFVHQGVENAEFDIEFTWEVSINNHWIPISFARPVDFNQTKWCCNDGVLKFNHTGDKAYEQWRICITKGEIKKSFFANQLYMWIE